MALYRLACEDCSEVIEATRKDRRFCNFCKKERRNSANRDKRKADPEKYRQYGREWRKNSSKTLAHDVQRSYGMTGERYQQMLEAQSGVCAICGGVNDDGKRLYVDHDNFCCPRRKDNRRQTCGNCTRGLLCRQCNIGLGGFRDNPELLTKAATYLARYGGDH